MEEVVEVRKYDKFYHTNGRLYAFLEMPIEALETLIPEGAKWGSKNEVYDEEGELVSSEQKIVDEFIMHKTVSIDGSKCMILLAAMERPCHRMKGVSESDLDDWAAYGEAVWGKTEADWMNVSEMQELLLTENYAIDEIE